MLLQLSECRQCGIGRGRAAGIADQTRHAMLCIVGLLCTAVVADTGTVRRLLGPELARAVRAGVARDKPFAVGFRQI